MEIGVDLDGFTEGSYNKMRVGSDFYRVKDSIEKLNHYAIEQGRHTRVTVGYHLYPGVTDLQDETRDFVKWCELNDMEYYFVPMHKWGNQIESIQETPEAHNLPKVHHSDRVAPCQFLWTNFMVTWDGRVPVCYQDSDISCLLGDITQMSISEVWNNSHRNIRKEQIHGNFSGICESCETATATKLPAFRSKLYPRIYFEGS